jgi:NADH-quinone oxidoreductase subunit N
MIDKTSWITAYPEIILLVMACVIVLVDLGVKSAQRTLTYVMTLALPTHLVPILTMALAIWW